MPANTSKTAGQSELGARARSLEAHLAAHGVRVRHTVAMDVMAKLAGHNTRHSVPDAAPAAPDAERDALRGLIERLAYGGEPLHDMVDAARAIIPRATPAEAPIATAEDTTTSEAEDARTASHDDLAKTLAALRDVVGLVGTSTIWATAWMTHGDEGQEMVIANGTRRLVIGTVIHGVRNGQQDIYSYETDRPFEGGPGRHWATPRERIDVDRIKMDADAKQTMLRTFEAAIHVARTHGYDVQDDRTTMNDVCITYDATSGGLTHVGAREDDAG